MPGLLLHVTSASQDCIPAQESTEDSGNEAKANGTMSLAEEPFYLLRPETTGGFHALFEPFVVRPLTKSSVAAAEPEV